MTVLPAFESEAITHQLAKAKEALSDNALARKRGRYGGEEIEWTRATTISYLSAKCWLVASQSLFVWQFSSAGRA